LIIPEWLSLAFHYAEKIFVWTGGEKSFITPDGSPTDSAASSGKPIVADIVDKLTATPRKYFFLRSDRRLYSSRVANGIPSNFCTNNHA
jgi:hypothetical protein